MLTGKELITDIENFSATKKQFAFWWLGQHGFIVKLRSATIYIDPYLSDHQDRQTPPLLQPVDVVNADLIFGTHDHDDHIDRLVWPQLAKSSSAAKFVVPEILRQELAENLNIPQERFIGLNDQQSVKINGLKITAVASAHEFLDRNKESGLYPYLGYIIEADGFSIYHAGDTCRYEGLETRLKKCNFDLVFFPINGRDARRLSAGCIGNMTYQEAADFAGALAPRVTVPAHYDMFKDNSENPQLFVDYMKIKYPKLKVCVCNYGERVAISCK